MSPLARQFSAAVDRYCLARQVDAAVERYAKRKPAKGQKELQWITIGGYSDGDKKHAEGTPVLVDSEGNIKGGPQALEGKNLDKLDRDVAGTEQDERKDNPPPKADQKAKGVEIKLKQYGSRWYAMADWDGKSVTRGGGTPEEARERAKADVEAKGGTVAGGSEPEKPAEKKPADPPKAKPETPPATSPATPPASPEGEGPKSPAGLFDKSLDSGDAPREAAAKAQKAAEESEYEFARESAVPNVGEDLKGSARHKVNAWRGLEQAERDGTAEQFVTRDNLLKAEPHNLMSVAQENPLSALAMHLAMKQFPAKPGYGRRGKPSAEEAQKDRRQFVETYRKLKETAEQIARESEDPLKATEKMRDAVSAQIRELRGQRGTESIHIATATDPYNSTANALVAMSKAMGRYGRGRSVPKQMGEFAGQVSQKYGELSNAEKRAKVLEHAQDMIEGKSLAATFGQTGQGKKPGYMNPADRYVNHAEREGGPDLTQHTTNPNRAAKFMLDNFGIRGLQWGNSVSDDERVHHAKHAAEAFADLVDIIGIDPAHASLGGKIGLAIGARGKGTALAHYEPDTQVINLTRKSGVGSLAHEWGHAFDHSFSEFSLRGTEGRSEGDYQSERISPKRFVKDENGQWKKDDKGRMMTEDLSSDPIWSAFENVRKAWRDSGFQRRLDREVSAAVRNGQISKGKREYWTSNREVFARTFERYIQRKLEKAGRKNTYLSGVTSDDLWPNDSEVDAMSDAFDGMFEAFRKHRGAAPKQKYSRAELVRYFMGQMDEAVERYAKRKPAKGQGGFSFKESDHPRAEDGTFKEKGSGDSGKKGSGPDEPFTLQQPKAERKKLDVEDKAGKQQGLFGNPKDELPGQKTMFDDHREASGPPAVKFVPHPASEDDHYGEMVYVDPRKLDAAWKRENSTYYLPPEGQGKGFSEVTGRRDRFREFLEKGEPIQASQVWMNDDGSVSFNDGRHRFAVLRDLGVKKVAVNVPKEQAEAVQQKFGPGSTLDVPERPADPPGDDLTKTLSDAFRARMQSSLNRTRRMDPLTDAFNKVFWAAAQLYRESKAREQGLSDAIAVSIPEPPEWLRRRRGYSRLAADFEVAVARYRKSDDASCGWVTIGSSPGEDGKRKGGTPVKICDGKITAGPKALTGRTMKRLIGPSAKSKRNQAVREIARSHGVDAKKLEEMAGHVWQERKELHGQAAQSAKIAREYVGLNQADVERMKNAGFDYSSDPRKLADRFPVAAEKMRRFDQYAEELAGSYPELGLDPDNPSADLWDLLSTGAQAAPSRHDREILTEAAERLLSSTGEPEDDGTDFDFGFNATDDSEPFSRQAALVRQIGTAVDRYMRRQAV